MEPAQQTPENPLELHILTRGEDELASAVMGARGRDRVRVIDLSTNGPDYDRLVEAIFAAESVIVW